MSMDKSTRTIREPGDGDKVFIGPDIVIEFYERRGRHRKTLHARLEFPSVMGVRIDKSIGDRVELLMKR